MRGRRRRPGARHAGGRCRFEARRFPPPDHGAKCNERRSCPPRRRAVSRPSRWLRRRACRGRTPPPAPSPPGRRAAGRRRPGGRCRRLRRRAAHPHRPFGRRAAAEVGERRIAQFLQRRTDPRRIGDIGVRQRPGDAVGACRPAATAAPARRPAPPCAAATAGPARHLQQSTPFRRDARRASRAPANRRTNAAASAAARRRDGGGTCRRYPAGARVAGRTHRRDYPDRPECRP